MATTTGSTTYLAGVSTFVRDVNDIEGCKITINSATTYDVSYCGDIALYYLNQHSGWDSFLIEGVCKRTDNLTEYTSTRKVSNTSNNFEKNRYMVEIQPTWELHTGWLTDAEAKRLAENLIPTTQLYIHDLKEDTIKPAYITDTSASHSTFKNNGRKMVNFTINVAESQTKTRR